MQGWMAVIRQAHTRHVLSCPAMGGLRFQIPGGVQQSSISSKLTKHLNQTRQHRALGGAADTTQTECKGARQLEPPTTRCHGGAICLGSSTRREEWRLAKMK
ncbi:hypothetical protein J3458_004620 [Metarhizium acridum]|uniref:uncharacterized protein n=1 Tax=Metarhizium acridum TaxID=92637 RepID=UPI001C6C9D56|nr:hypothetical protein J3458_004620 [Metarhizium acridum]